MARVSNSGNRLSFGKADPRRLSNSVGDMVRDAILDGRLQPGAELSELEVAGQMGVSRSPVREALRQLAEEGLVVSIPYKGTYVTDLSEERVAEVYSLRAVLEEFAVRRAVPRMTDDDVARIEKIMDTMGSAARRNRRSEAMDADLAFHRELCRLAGHTLLLQTWEQILFQVLRCINQAVYKRDLMSAFDDHTETFAAIKARDAERAATSIRRHIEAAASKSLESLASAER